MDGQKSGGAQAAAVAAERARLAESMADARTELASTLGELRVAVREQLDWRAWVRAHPFATVALAAAIGWRLGRGGWW
jgi:ElaB/YqjD/DUF883 family membrane-anchored ribosome-binding protein